MQRKITILLFFILISTVISAQFRPAPRRGAARNNSSNSSQDTSSKPNGVGDTSRIRSAPTFNISPSQYSDTTIVDTITIDENGFNAKKYISLRPKMNNALKSDADIKAKAIEKAQATSAENKKNALSKKVLSNATNTSSSKPADTLILSMPELREDDAVYNEFVWREIDARQKINRGFIHKGYNQQGDRRLFAILLKILKEKDESGFFPAVTAFAPGNGDDFIEPLTLGSIDSLFTPIIRKDTNRENVQITGRVIINITKKAKINPESIYTFRLKEQYIYDKKYSQLFRRIIGIAPVAIIPSNKIIPVPGLRSKLDPRKDSVRKELPEVKELFWVNYDEIRPFLSKYLVYNPENKATEMSWSDLLDLGYFDATIYKTTIDNQNDKSLKELFLRDPKKRLEYAEKMKQKIFDQEQDRWVY